MNGLSPEEARDYAYTYGAADTITRVSQHFITPGGHPLTPETLAAFLDKLTEENALRADSIGEVAE